MSTTFQEKLGLGGIELTRERIRFWGIRSGLSVLDQGLTSGAGFLLNLFLARWLTSEAYGAFAIGFATLLLLSGYHNALLLEPMTVLGPAKYSGEMNGYLWGQLKVHAIVVALLSCTMLLVAAGMALFGAQHSLVSAIVGSAVALPFVLLFWLIRRMCYVVHKIGMAAWASAGYLALLLGGTLALHGGSRLDSTTAFLLMAGASLAAVVVPLRKLGLMDFGRLRGIPWKQVAKEDWSYGRWLMASTTLFSISNQAQMYVVAAILGLGAAGVLRAMQIPALLMTQIVSATALLLLPTMSYEFGQGHFARLRRKAVIATTGVTAMAVVYALLLAVFAKPIEHALFAGKFAAYAELIPVLGLVPVCTGFWLGFSLALRASQKPHFELLANGIAAPVSLVTAIAFIRFWGVLGAAVSLVAGSAVIGVVLLWSFLRSNRDPNG